jgi:hypothetical protein
MPLNQSIWLVTGVFSTTMLLAWLFIDKRVTTTGLLSAGGWATMALTGGSLEVIGQSGSRIATQAGPLQYFCTLLALLSLLAVILHRFGHYPPPTDRTERTQNVAD